jgi:hypothetical protein
VALQAEGADVGEAAFAAAFGHGDNVVGVPEMTAAAPLLFELPARRVVQLALIAAEGFGIGAARGANSAVSLKDLGAQVGGVRAQFPFMNAGLAAKGDSPP